MSAVPASNLQDTGQRSSDAIEPQTWRRSVHAVLGGGKQDGRTPGTAVKLFEYHFPVHNVSFADVSHVPPRSLSVTLNAEGATGSLWRATQRRRRRWWFLDEPGAVVQLDGARVRALLRPAAGLLRGSGAEGAAVAADVGRGGVGVAVVQSGDAVGGRVELEGGHAGGRVEAVAEADHHAEHDERHEDDGHQEKQVHDRPASRIPPACRWSDGRCDDEAPSQGRRLTTGPVSRLEALLHTVDACSRLQPLRHSLEEGGEAARRQR